MTLAFAVNAKKPVCLFSTALYLSPFSSCDSLQVVVTGEASLSPLLYDLYDLLNNNFFDTILAPG